MKVLQQTNTKLVLHSPTSWHRVAVAALVRFVLTGTVLGVFYFSAVSRLLDEGQQTQLSCDRPYPSYIQCELTQADEDGSIVTTKISGLQAAKASPAPVATNSKPYADCQVVLFNYGGEQTIPLGEFISSSKQQCTQAKKLEQRINYFVQNPNVRFLTLEEDNRHDPVPTWWFAGLIWGATALLVALVPALFVRIDTWEFDRTHQRLFLKRRWFWRSQTVTIAFLEIAAVQVVDDHDRWQRPRCSLQLHLQTGTPLTIVPKDYGSQHRDRCDALSQIIQDAIV